MTKILPFVIAVLICCTGKCYGNLSSISLEARGAAFFPSSAKYKRIYGSVDNTWGGEITIGNWRACQLWMSGDWLTDTGKSIGVGNRTDIDVGTLSFGIKKTWTILSCIDLYGGLGCSFGHVWLKNKGACDRKNVNKHSLGIVVKSGVRRFLANDFFIGLFTDYSYQPVHFHRTVDVGGWKVGLSVGKALNF